MTVVSLEEEEAPTTRTENRVVSVRTLIMGVVCLEIVKILDDGVVVMLYVTVHT